MNCSTEYQQSDRESIRSFQSVRSYKEICGAFDSKGSRRPQRSTSTMVNGDCTTSRLRNVWRVSSDSGHRDSDQHCNILLVLEVVWRQKSTKLWALSRLQSHICTLAKLSLVTFLVTEPASFCYCWIYWLFEWFEYYRKYWKDIRLFCLYFVEGYTPSHFPY